MVKNNTLFASTALSCQDRWAKVGFPRKLPMRRMPINQRKHSIHYLSYVFPLKTQMSTIHDNRPYIQYNIHIYINALINVLHWLLTFYILYWTETAAVMYSRRMRICSRCVVALIAGISLYFFISPPSTIYQRTVPLHPRSKELFGETGDLNRHFKSDEGQRKTIPFNYVNSNHSENTEIQLEIQRAGYTKSELRNLKIVIFWNRWYNNLGWGHNLGKLPLINSKCKFTNCFFSNNTNLQHIASAFIFHGNPYTRWLSLPRERRANQSYVFFSRESPARANYRLKDLEGLFNLTMTYRFDSDLLSSYGKFIPVSNPKFQEDSSSGRIKAQVKGKRGKVLIAWFVSHCNTKSRREDYVRELRKYIAVDIYGKCGQYTCSRYNSTKCYTMLNRKYKFYLSFENSVCPDYITEKIFKILKLDSVVPVVYGGANYSRVTPPKSVINVKDFASPKDLADYLRYLDSHDDAFLEYLQWKRRYSIKNVGLRSGLCDLCGLLNDATFHHKVYNDLTSFWGPQTCNENYIQDLLNF